VSGESSARSRFIRYLTRRSGAPVVADARSLPIPPLAVPAPAPADDRRVRLNGYALNDAELRTFARLLEALDIPVAVGELIARLDAVMTASDVVHLVALLSFASARRPVDAAAGHAARVTRTADAASLPPSPHRRLNLLFITGEFPNPVHGGGGRVADFIKALSRDHDIYLYSGYEERDVGACAALRPYCRRIDLRSYHEFDANFEAIRSLIADVDIDVVHYEYPRALTNYHRAWGTHHVFTFMEAVSLRVRVDMDRTVPLGPDWLRLMIRLIKTLKVELVDADQADCLIVASERDGRFYTRLDFGREYHVLNHGVDFESFCLPDTPTEPHALTFVGNFRHRPNEDAMRWFFGDVFSRIRARIPDVTLYVVGADPTDDVRAHHDGRQVVVTGTVDDVRPYIQRASVCLAPLVTGAGLRGKLIQYAALERVCVATSIAAAGLRFEDARDIVITDDAAEFAERVVFLLENPAVARGMAAAAYETARTHYTRTQLTRQLYGIHEQMDRRGAAASRERRRRPEAAPAP
jgi:glycosyltransferase involved in cell wall biosynthesis